MCKIKVHQKEMGVRANRPGSGLTTVAIKKALPGLGRITYPDTPVYFIYSMLP